MRLASVFAAAFVVATPAFAGNIDIDEITVERIQQGLKSGEFTAVELVQAYLDRIETYEPIYNAYVALNDAALSDPAVPGQFADIAVLSQDLFTADPETIPDTTCEMTILGGKVVYTAGAAAP